MTKQEQIDSLTQTIQRLQADFENYKRRTEGEKADFTQYACSNIILDLLSVLDNLELALKHTSDKDDFVKGIELVYANLIDILHKKGLKPIKALKEPFDPIKHEAMMQEKSSEKEGTVIEEFQKGYMLNEKVLRPSKVKVAKR